MRELVLHSDTGLNLPLSPDVGVAVLLVGAAILAVIGYDAYRQYTFGEGS